MTIILDEGWRRLEPRMAGAQTKAKQPAATRVRQPDWMTLNRVGSPQEGLAMAIISATKTFTAILSVATLGAAIRFGTGTALAQDKNVTEDQILRALAPEKKPLTRGLSIGPQTVVDPAASRRRGQIRPEDPWPLHAVAVERRARGNRRHRQGQAEDRSGDQLRLQLGRYQREIAAVGSGARPRADQQRPQRLDLRGRGPHRCGRRRRL